MKSCVFFILFYLKFVLTLNENYKPDWNSLDTRPIPQWFDDAKIGIFIHRIRSISTSSLVERAVQVIFECFHWGVFSVPAVGTEWMWWYWKGEKPQPEIVSFMKKNYPPDWSYADFAQGFHAELYDPSEWADLFAASGAKYVVLTTKHHEGFAMWPSKYSFNWNSVDVGPKRDLIGEFTREIRNRTNLRIGFYHSLYEWFHPLYLEDKKTNFATQNFPQKKILPELIELIDEYRPELIWSDGDWEAPDTYWNSTSFLSWLYNESPVKSSIVVNDRWGLGTWCQHGDYYTCNDRFNPGHLLPHKWENCFTIDKNSWAFRRTSKLNDYMTIEEILQELIVTISTGGNVLVNIGPAADGTIPIIYEERLRQMGQWLSINGEAIYQTNPWKFQNDSIHHDVWFTKSKENSSVYAFLLVWPQNSTEILLGAPIPTNETIVTLFGSDSNPLKWNFLSNDTGMIIDLSTINLFRLKSQWSWVFQLEHLKNQ